MAKRVAVEDGLENVRQALRREGFEITKFTSGTMSNVDCAVVTGMSNNFMGIADTNGNKFPVIEASGRNAQDIVGEIQTLMSKKEGQGGAGFGAT